MNSARAAKTLVAELDHFRCPYCAAQHKWNLRAPPSIRTNSITAEAFCRSCGEQVFLKRMLFPDCTEAARRAEQEFAVTSDIHKKFGRSPAIGVVKPFGRHKSLLLFEHFVGDSPMTVLKSGGLDAAEAMMRRIAAWLAHLHQTSGLTKGVIDLSDRLTDVSSRIERQQLRKSNASRALLYLQQKLPEPGVSMMSHRLLHGDAKPDNFLFDGRRLVGFDIDGRFRNLPEYDLAQFLSQYELSSCGIAGKMDDARRRHLEHAFTDSYCRLMPLDTAILEWIHVYFLLSFWLSWRAPSTLHHIRWDPLFDRRMQHCLDDKNGSYCMSRYQL